jgi:hypothetical protein
MSSSGYEAARAARQRELDGLAGLANFTTDITWRAEWARDHNDGRPNPAWSTGEQLIVALVLHDKATLDAEEYTRAAAARRLAGDLTYYGYSDATDTWLREIRAAIGSLTDVELPYTRCPSCGLAGEPGSMDYRRADGGGIDWSGAAHASCGFCGRTHEVTRDQVLPLDGEYTCPRDGCGTVTPCSGFAARVRCDWCGVYGFGPGAASDADRAHLLEVERLHALELRQAVLSAHRRADMRC